MNTILQDIVAYKQKEVANSKSLYTLAYLEKSKYFQTKCVSMVSYLTTVRPKGIIAEFKRKSPSKGWINKYADAREITVGYLQAGASALSVLTDANYFGAKQEDFSLARDFNYCPILRKEFIIDPYQVYESKAKGADAILLIAKILSPRQVEDLCRLAHDLGMEVLLEIQNREEALAYGDIDVDMIGVNNRDLNTFGISIENSIELYENLPSDKVKIAESGIKSYDDVIRLRSIGFQGFLVGTHFMATRNPSLVCEEFIKAL